MKIYYSTNSDPMFLGSIKELNTLHLALKKFLDSKENSLFIKTDVADDPTPYKQFLTGIEFIKSDGSILATITEKKIFQIKGSIENLKIYCEYFSFREDEDGRHHHPEYVMKKGYISPNTMSLIIEADNDI